MNLTLALPADLPMVWESPDTLRIGVEQPLARLTGLTAAEQRFLSALARGIPLSRVDEISKKCCLSPALRRALLEKINEVIEQKPARSLTKSPLRVNIVAGGHWPSPEWAQVLGGALGSTGAQCAVVRSEHAVSDADVLVLPERYAAPLTRASPWLSLGVPVLSVRLRDRAVLVGPVLGRPGAPCLDCCNQAEADRDPAWAAVTCQVSGAPPPSETPAVALVVAAHAVNLLSGDEPPGAQMRLAVTHGRPVIGGERSLVSQRSECACATLEALQRADVEG